MTQFPLLPSAQAASASPLGATDSDRFDGRYDEVSLATRLGSHTVPPAESRRLRTSVSGARSSSQTASTFPVASMPTPGVYWAALPGSSLSFALGFHVELPAGSRLTQTSQFP